MGDENSAANVKKIAALPAENARERNSDSGSIGARARASQATNAAASSTPAASDATTSGLPQPARLPRTSPHTMPERGAGHEREAADVEVGVGPEALPMRVSTSGMTTSAIGTLSQKIHSQLTPSTTAPPISGPLATEMPVMRAEDPDRRAAAVGREGGAEQRQAERHQERRSGALDGARGDQPAGVGRQRAGGRGAANRPSPSA